MLYNTYRNVLVLSHPPFHFLTTRDKSPDSSELEQRQVFRDRLRHPVFETPPTHTTSPPQIPKIEPGPDSLPITSR